jgi:hypothetical protein
MNNIHVFLLDGRGSSGWSMGTIPKLGFLVGALSVLAEHSSVLSVSPRVRLIVPRNGPSMQ